MLGKYDLLGEHLLEQFRARPDHEPLWTALREMFVRVVPEPGSDVPVHAIERVIAETPSLRGGYLYRVDRVQQTVAAEARTRARRAGAPYGDTDPTPEAAFAALIAARTVRGESASPWGETVDAALRAIRPPG